MIIVYILFFICIALLIFVLIHKLLLALEKNKIIPIGKMVRVDDKNMHVYSEGKYHKELPTLVIMSGSSIPSPIYNYKKLYSKFSDSYRVVVPEKFGYGYSDITQSPRDVETILEQTRKSLQLAGEKAPYILIPHSMSGIEAQLWALKYPNEVAAIIGLDMALPSHYENMNLGFGIKCYKLFSDIARHIGLQRLRVFQKAAGVYDAEVLSEKDWQQEKYLIYKMTLNKMIYKEAAAILNSAISVKNAGIPSVPMLLFVSDGTVGKGWIEQYKKYTALTPNAEIVELDCGHMMHNYCAERIAELSKKFINDINGKGLQE